MPPGTRPQIGQVPVAARSRPRSGLASGFYYRRAGRMADRPSEQSGARFPVSTPERHLPIPQRQRTAPML